MDRAALDGCESVVRERRGSLVIEREVWAGLMECGEGERREQGRMDGRVW